MRITVVLMANDGISQHASGQLDAEKLADNNCIKRNERLYLFNSYSNNVAYFNEASSQPYVITEW